MIIPERDKGRWRIQSPEPVTRTLLPSFRTSGEDCARWFFIIAWSWQNEFLSMVLNVWWLMYNFRNYECPHDCVWLGSYPLPQGVMYCYVWILVSVWINARMSASVQTSYIPDIRHKALGKGLWQYTTRIKAVVSWYVVLSNFTSS